MLSCLFVNPLRHFSILLGVVFFLPSCSVLPRQAHATSSAAEVAGATASTTIPPHPATTAPQNATEPPSPLPQITPPPRPSSPAMPPSYQRLTVEAITIDLLRFDARDYYLAVADQASLGGVWRSAQEARNGMKRGIAAINGGFFQPSGAPLGLVISGGKKAGDWSTASALTSGIYYQKNRAMGLARSRQTPSALRQNAEHLLQAGPFLLEKGRLVSGLSQTKTARRSVLLTDGKNGWALALTSAASLHALAEALGSDSFQKSFPATSALNLDGGRSCDLSLSSAVEGGPFSNSHWLKSAVRNYLVLRPY